MFNLLMASTRKGDQNVPYLEVLIVCKFLSISLTVNFINIWPLIASIANSFIVTRVYFDISVKNYFFHIMIGTAVLSM